MATRPVEAGQVRCCVLPMLLVINGRLCDVLGASATMSGNRQGRVFCSADRKGPKAFLIVELL